MLENLSDTTKKFIVVLAIVAIVLLKVYGATRAKLPLYIIIALGAISVITEAKPLASG